MSLPEPPRRCAAAPIYPFGVYIVGVELSRSRSILMDSRTRRTALTYLGSPVMSERYANSM
ncbi:alpha-1_2-Mannosidase [Caligus rogercresseyi]|uniref:Alpha-1_2-Mannosidase n=1 Tax=Caligus rogercresseyi TaxID=217165 RepID=A0A7T8HKL0_CALRO|nr:alpha-1_2-Mannosidase [Caligus rogercresseyi]